MPAAASAFALSHDVRFLQQEHDRHDEKRGKDTDEEEHPPAAISPEDVVAPGGTGRLISEPMMLPVADSAWSEPERHRAKPAGTLSATSVVAAPNMPPMPIPARNR